MASPSDPVATPAKKQTMKSDGELLQSLRGLSLSTSPLANTPPSARSPSLHTNSNSYRPAVDRSPSALSARTSSRASSYNLGSGRESRAATPSLVRQASMNSLQPANRVAPPRRTASGNVPASPDSSRPPPPTANSVARTYFRGELEKLHGDSESNQRAADTIVILHDACYGHRYARPKTSRAALSTIVERPERIKACVLGVAAAYVLLGERHCDGEYPPHPSLNAANMPSIPFRIHKSTRRMPLASPAVTNVHGTKWMEELKIMCDAAEGKLAMGGKELQRPEMNRGAEHEPEKLHEGDLYLCQESLEALEGSLGAVADAVDTVFKEGGPRRAFVAVRPPGHHCSASYPSGFCWVNNVHVGIMHAVLAHGLTHAAIIDFDLHHGDGSQAITWQHNSRGVGLAKNAAFWKKASIGYYSLHDINSYPCEQGDEEKTKNASLCIDNAHGQHVWNVHLEAWKTEPEFWELYEDKYKVLLEKARKYLKAHTERLRMSNQTSKAAIFLSAGFDASEWEGAGMQRHSVNVPTSFYARIAQDVTKIAEEEGTSVHGRVISVLEGGYSDRALTSGVLSHISGLAGSEPISGGGEVNHPSQEMAGLMVNRRNSLELKLRPHDYATSWWNSENLEMLETGVVLSPVVPRAPKGFNPGNFSSPTTSSTAKMVEIARLRRQASLNGIVAPRAPTPPPPEVPWAVAAHGLSSVLTLTEQSTTSHRPDELTAEATRVRRERYMASMGITEEPVEPAPAPTAPAPARKSTRERKAPKSYLETSGDDEKAKHRRRTVAGAAVLAPEKGGSRSTTPQIDSRGPSKPQARRLSASSTILESSGGGASVPHAARAVTSMEKRSETAISVATIAETLPRPPPVKESVPEMGHAARLKADAALTTKPRKATTKAEKSGSKSTCPTRPQVGSGDAAKAEGHGLDKITSGIKKITLVTSQQKQGRTRESKKTADVNKVAASNKSKNPSLPATPRDERQRALAPPEGKEAVVTGPSLVEKHRPETEQDHRAAEPAVEAPAAETVAIRIETPTQSSNPGTPSNIFVEYQPGGSTPTAITPRGPLEWLPINSSEGTSPDEQQQPMLAPKPTVSSPAYEEDDVSQVMSPSPMKRAQVPVFTPTSQLRFAPRTGRQPQKSSAAPTLPEAGHRRDNDLWEVPESPDHLA